MFPDPIFPTFPEAADLPMSSLYKTKSPASGREDGYPRTRVPRRLGTLCSLCPSPSAPPIPTDWHGGHLRVPGQVPDVAGHKVLHLQHEHGAVPLLPRELLLHLHVVRAGGEALEDDRAALLVVRAQVLEALPAAAEQHRVADRGELLQDAEEAPDVGDPGLARLLAGLPQGGVELVVEGVGLGLALPRVQEDVTDFVGVQMRELVGEVPEDLLGLVVGAPQDLSRAVSAVGKRGGGVTQECTGREEAFAFSSPGR